MPYAHPEALVSTEWLAAHLRDPHIRVLDSSFKQPGVTPTARADYDAGHIPGAVYFDIDDVAQPGTTLPHMIPTAERFAEKMAERGIGNDDKVIVYDANGLSSAGRAWWMLQLFGHDNVALLDGGFGKWTKEKCPTEMSPVRPEPKSLSVSFNAALVRGLSEMNANLATGAEQVIDARGPGKFYGTQQDVFPFRKLGHIPNAKNVPWGDLINPDSGAFLASDALTARFVAAGIDLSRPIVTTCASGITSCMVALALYLLGHKSAAVYDGSWAEWGLAEHTPAVAA
jgi:thiosulfate/3-mercaptopyruvate sulfurtransferase